MKAFEKITQVRLPFDLRHPTPSKNYGIHGLDIWFILKGPKGATQFAVTFPQYLPHVDREYRHKFPDWEARKEIMGVDVGYHAKEPQFEGQSPMSNCTICSPCYYDGSSLRADDWAKEIFSAKGKKPEEEIWKRLEEEYVERFGPVEE